MSFKQALIGAAVAIMLATPLSADELSAELEEVGAQIDQQYMDWDTPVRTEILSLYFTAQRPQQQCHEEAAAEAALDLME
jgi:hypothetical protein